LKPYLCFTQIVAGSLGLGLAIFALPSPLNLPGGFVSVFLVGNAVKRLNELHPLRDELCRYLDRVAEEKFGQKYLGLANFWPSVNLVPRWWRWVPPKIPDDVLFDEVQWELVTRPAKIEDFALIEWPELKSLGLSQGTYFTRF
jgi:hypothetical protein